MGVPALSVLMCSNVDNAWVGESLQSIFNQTFTDWELIFVVNGVTDVVFSSLVKRCSDPRVRVIRSDVNGLTYSLNLGLHFARAPLIARMDADDIAEPRRLEIQIAHMRAHPNITVCGSAYNLIDTRGLIVKTKTVRLTDQDIRRALRYCNPLCHPTVILRREAVAKVGGYAGNGSAEDYELWCRLAEDKNVLFCNMPDVLLGYRLPATGIARRARRAYIHACAAQVRALLQSGNPSWAFGAILSAVKSITRGVR
jgi:glycosyltransferase involved in cell wall biosynthesis